MKGRWHSLKPGESVEWPTPLELYRVLDQEFHFTLDPCPYGGSEDGRSTLFKPWVGERVFCNPPYGPGLWHWLQRGPEADVAVFLIPARTDTQWFHKYVMPHASEVRFIRGRLKFGDATSAAPFASMLVVYQGWQVLTGGLRVSSMKAPAESSTLMNRV